MGGPLTVTLVDDFATQDTAKWFGWDANTTHTGSQVQVACTNGYPGLRALGPYDFRASSVAVEVPQIPNLGNGTTEAMLFVEQVGTPGNRVQIMVGGGFMVFREYIGFVGDDTFTAYSATDHRWWRIGMVDATVTWETSADGASWTVQRTKGTALDLAAVEVVLSSGFYGTEPTPGSTIFDNVNVAPVARSMPIPLRPHRGLLMRGRR